MRWLAALLCWLTLTQSALAQVVPVSAGEHADFTRLVLQMPAGTGWRLSGTGTERGIVLAPADATFDLSRLFARIPRTRLAAAAAQGNRLQLTLACDCALRAWEDRPGLVILDLRDAPTDPIAAVATPPAPPRPVPDARVVIDPIDTARAAGSAFAQSLAAQPAPAPTPAPQPQLQSLARDLGLSLSRALGQGLLDPAPERAEPGVLLASDNAPAAALPENMRIASVLDRPDPDAPAPARLAATCQGAEILDTLLDLGDDGFSETYGRLTRSLFAEFDQPDPEARLDLITLYLASGFGAEARALLENAPDPVAGRDLALGMADVLEDRASNSRMRLAQSADCGGVAAVMAVLAGAPIQASPDLATPLSLTFSRLPGVLRALLGARMVEILAQSGAIDAARVVADSVTRSPWFPPSDGGLLQAMLDRARGYSADALLRLEHDNRDDPPDVQARLDLALETQAAVPAPYLEDASALAATERNSDSGPALMASILRVQARSGMSEDAFATLDRLERWMAETGENRRLLDQLRDEVWNNLARRGSDLGIVQSVLAREDWRDRALSRDTRLALAGRLIDLGLVTPVADLVGTDPSPDAAHMLARASLAEGEPRQALDRLQGHDDTVSRQIRAAALARLGDSAGAAAEFAALGIPDQALRNAIAAGDWPLVESLSAAGGPSADLPGDLGDLLGRAPGHAEIARDLQTDAPPAPRTGSAQGIETGGPDAGRPGPGAAPAPQEPEPSGRFATGVSSEIQGGVSTAPSLGPNPPDPSPGDRPVGNGDGQPPSPGLPAAEAAGTGGRDDLTATAALSGTGAEPEATRPAARPEPADIARQFDRLGLVSRSSTLLAESERLRNALAPLVAAPSRP